jgi:hypothetical protein
MVVSAEQSKNIYDMSFTFSVLKLLKSSEVRDVQPLNISYIFSTLPVVKLLKSSEVREEQ